MDSEKSHSSNHKPDAIVHALASHGKHDKARYKSAALNRPMQGPRARYSCPLPSHRQGA
jgi:hypothetical protein